MNNKKKLISWMKLFKKWAKQNWIIYLLCTSVFSTRYPVKHETKNVNKNLNFCNILDLLTSRTQKTAWWPPDFDNWCTSGTYVRLILSAYPRSWICARFFNFSYKLFLNIICFYYEIMTRLYMRTITSPLSPSPLVPQSLYWEKN